MNTKHYNSSPIKHQILSNEIIDLSNLNLFDATKEIIMTSTYFFNKKSTKKIKYKVATPSIKNLLNDFPSINNSIELIF